MQQLCDATKFENLDCIVTLSGPSRAVPLFRGETIVPVVALGISVRCRFMTSVHYSSKRVKSYIPRMEARLRSGIGVYLHFPEVVILSPLS